MAIGSFVTTATHTIPTRSGSFAGNVEGSHAAIPAKDTFQPFAKPRTGPSGPEPLDDGRHDSASPAISPDSRWVAYNRADHPGSSAFHLAVIPAAGTGELLRFDFNMGTRSMASITRRASPRRC